MTFVSERFREFEIRGAERLRRVQNMQHYVASLDGVRGALHANSFDLTVRTTKSSGVNKAKGNALDVCKLFKRVARRSSNRCNDGAILTQQCVQKARFAHVRATDDSHGDAFA